MAIASAQVVMSRIDELEKKDGCTIEMSVKYANREGFVEADAILIHSAPNIAVTALVNEFPQACVTREGLLIPVVSIKKDSQESIARFSDEVIAVLSAARTLVNEWGEHGNKNSREGECVGRLAHAIGRLDGRMKRS